MTRTQLGIVMVVMIGCRGAAPPDVDPVTLAQATALAERYGRDALPCKRDALVPLFDAEAFAARFRHGDSSLVLEGAVAGFSKVPLGEIVCAWNAKAESYTLVRIRIVDGQPRPLFRRVQRNPRTHLQAVAYDELMLGASRRDHVVRIIDVFPYAQGAWLSATMRATTDAALASAAHDDHAPGFTETSKRARALQDAGKSREALDVLDTLPATIRHQRSIQVLRVVIANGISREAHQQALDELAATFPGDPSVALLEVDGAVMRGDYDAAIRYVDQVDQALGGDTWQAAVRAELLTKRNRPGDLEAAQRQADAAVAAEPRLAKAWWAKLDVALARQRWADAITAMDTLQGLGVKLALDVVRSSAVYRGLIDTPEFHAWAARHEPAGPPGATVP